MRPTRRWGIENKAFNELTQFYHLEHCYHTSRGHAGANVDLILGFVLFNAYALLTASKFAWGG